MRQFYVQGQVDAALKVSESTDNNSDKEMFRT
jgi:hypothetical protein